MLRDELAVCTTPQEKAARIWANYVSRKLHSNLEPEWTHPAYELLRQFSVDPALVPQDNIRLIKEMMASFEMPDGFEVSSFPNVPKSPVRIMHDGWKIGTPTWVFMGRSENQHARALGHDWVAVAREVPEDLAKNFDPRLPRLVWIAYNTKEPMGLTAISNNCIGPAIYFDELVSALESKTKKKFST